MRRTLLGGSVWLLACGPQVMLDFGDGSSSDDSGSDAPVVTTGTPPADEVTSEPATSGPVDPDTTGEPVDPGECWQVQNLFEAPADVDVRAYDQDGDGADELWLSYQVDNGPGPGATTLIPVDADGVPGEEIVLDAFFVGMSDVEGDGWLDLLLVDFSNGFPPVFAYVPGVAPGEFAFPPVPLQIELDQGVSGFFDADNDGPLDAFMQHDDGTFEMLAGDGLGAFVVSSSLMLPVPAGRTFTVDVEGAGAWFVRQTQLDMGGGPGPMPAGCRPLAQELFDATGGVISPLAGSPPDEGATVLGPLVRARAYDSGTVTTYAIGCDPAMETPPELRQLVYAPGKAELSSVSLMSGLQWAAVADVDGDGLLDLVHVNPEHETVAWTPGSSELAFGSSMPTGIEPNEVRGNRAYPVDLDGDGREEVLRGWVLVDAEPAQLYWDRIYLGPCP